MTKPDDIPQDIWDAAHRAIEDNDFTGRGPSVVERCARAIMARDAVWAAAASYGDGSPMYTPEKLRESIAGMMASRDASILSEKLPPDPPETHPSPHG